MRVQIKTAILAREKSFDESCDWVDEDEDIRRLNYYEGDGSGDGGGFTKNSGIEGYVDYTVAIPTQSELQKWLRDVHKIQIEVEADWNQEMTEIIGYYNFTYKTWSEKVDIVIKNKLTSFALYEEALEDGLLAALKTL